MPQPQAHQDVVDGCLDTYLPTELTPTTGDLKTAIPRLVEDPHSVASIRAAVARIPTRHELILGDARSMELPPESVHLEVRSPSYWTPKRYQECAGQLGHVAEHGQFLSALDEVWRRCFEALVPSGRLVCIVGDVCLSRRRNHGRHAVVPLHAPSRSAAAPSATTISRRSSGTR